RTNLTIWAVLFLGLSLLPFIVSLGSAPLKFFKFLLVGGVAVALAYFLKPGALRVLKLSLWCYAFIMLGYFMYFTALIRSNANPSIDMNNVDNPVNLVYYLSREQYGSAPIVYGPHFLAEVERDEAGYPQIKEGEMRYVKGDKKYIEIGRQREYKYSSEDKQLFPRIWDPSNDQFHFDTYIDWLNLDAIIAPEYSIVTQATQGLVQVQNQEGKSQSFAIEDNYSVRVRQGQVLYRGDKIAVKEPSYGDSFRWFFSYQMSFMYWRYFMWNFAGKQNDIQGGGNRRDGNWITGLPFIDNTRLGDQDNMPVSLKHNKANNKLYLIPFVLGILGCVYQYLRNRKDWIVSFLLFFLTGIAVVLYLNQPGSQPRERDYAYVGSFYAFAIWIGLAVVALVRLAREKADKQTFTNTLLYGSILTFFIMVMSTANETGSGLIMTAIYSTVIYAAIAGGLTYLLRAVSSNGQNTGMLNIATTAICLIAPVLMAQQEWDDHDRSQKTLAPDLARNYLESCAPNAIIFTFGDNDTYPLWYAQEVEGVRPDIRIINNSLLGIDWYINQLRYKVNNADSVDVIWTEEQIEGHNREYLFFQPGNVPQDRYYPLYDAMKNVIGKETRDPKTQRDVGPETYPVKRFSIPVDINLVRKNGTVNANDSVLSEIRFEVPGNSMQRNDLMILNIIAANNWKRPIYFTAAFGELGFGDYLRKDGMAYRLVPVANKFPQQNWTVNQAMRQMGLGSTQIRDNNMDTMYNTLLTKYLFGGANKKGVYFDEENRRHLLNIRALFAEAAGNLADAGKKQEAIRLLERAEQGIDPANLPYAMTSRFNSHNQTALVYLEACYKAGKTDLADKLRQAIRNDLTDQKKYYEYMRDSRPESFGGFERSEYPINEILLQVLDIVEKKYAPQSATTPATEGNTTIQTGIPGQDSIKKDTPR
ncbi:MAG TPA: DUF2723 domain-containing protein, partial [Chitinophagaceae bacterium]|nr:DUF2723 domain-containing protein [Chitinophagaceae bacterium]